GTPGGRTWPSSSPPTGPGRSPAWSWPTAPGAACPSGRARPGRRPGAAWPRPGSRCRWPTGWPGPGASNPAGRPGRGRGGDHSAPGGGAHADGRGALSALVGCRGLLCVAGAPADGGELAVAKRGAVGRALELLPSAHVTWYEDTMHDIPLQRPAELAAELARFAKEVPGRG